MRRITQADKNNRPIKKWFKKLFNNKRLIFYCMIAFIVLFVAWYIVATINDYSNVLTIIFALIVILVEMRFFAIKKKERQMNKTKSKKKRK